MVVYWIIYSVKKSKDDQVYYGLSNIAVSSEHASLASSFLKQVLLYQVLKSTNSVKCMQSISEFELTNNNNSSDIYLATDLLFWNVDFRN